MLPYLEVPPIRIGTEQVHVFEFLLVVAVVTGFEVTVRRAPRPEQADMSRVATWAVVWGFLGAFTFHIVAYHPKVLMDWDTLKNNFGGMSSFGGIMGGLLGALTWMWRHRWTRFQVIAALDRIAFGFVFAWVFGRLGCATAHDHLGIFTDHWLAVEFPNGKTRLDLGLLEFLYTLILASVFFTLSRIRTEWPIGFFASLFLVLYGPVRFTLDFFRTADERYFQLTPGQYCSALATLAGIALAAWTRRNRAHIPTES